MLDHRTALVTAKQLDRLAGMFRHRERIQMSRRIQMGTWVPFEGPRGGHGAKSVETGEVVYGEAGRELLKSRTNALDDITTSGNNKVSVGDTHSSAKGKEMATIEKRSSSKNVDAYRSTKPQRIDGDVVVITAYGRSMDDHGMYIHRMKVRPATEEEAKQVEIDELKASLRAMGNGPDDERDREKHVATTRQIENKIRSIEGRPSIEEEEDKKAKERAAKIPAAIAKAKAAMAADKNATVIDDDGDEVPARDIFAVKDALTMLGVKYLSNDAVRKMSDDEINKILDGYDGDNA